MFAIFVKAVRQPLVHAYSIASLWTWIIIFFFWWPVLSGADSFLACNAEKRPPVSLNYYNRVFNYNKHDEYGSSRATRAGSGSAKTQFVIAKNYRYFNIIFLTFRHFLLLPSAQLLPRDMTRPLIDLRKARWYSLTQLLSPRPSHHLALSRYPICVTELQVKKLSCTRISGWRGRFSWPTWPSSRLLDIDSLWNFLVES